MATTGWAKVTGGSIGTCGLPSMTMALRRPTTPTVAAVLAAVVALVLAACAGDDDNAAPDDADEAVAAASDESDAEGSTGSGAETAGAIGEAEVRLLAIGDSVLEWNGDRSTPDRAAAALNERGIVTTVDNRSVSGSCLTDCYGFELFPTIGDTYDDAGDWTHVLLSGGGNDVGESCEPADPLVTADLGAGALVELVDRIPATTTIVLYLYAPPSDPGDPLGACDVFPVLGERYRQLADARDNVVIADAALVADASTPEYYDDSVHPSPAGSEVIGRLVADVIESTLQPTG